MNFKTSPPQDTDVAAYPQLIDSFRPVLTVLPPAKKEFPLFVVSRYRPGQLVYTSRRHPESVPEIRFGGNYLYHFSFPIGSRLMVSIQKGKIIITPHEDQPYLSEEEADELRAWVEHPANN